MHHVLRVQANSLLYTVAIAIQQESNTSETQRLPLTVQEVAEGHNQSGDISRLCGHVWLDWLMRECCPMDDLNMIQSDKDSGIHWPHSSNVL